MVVEAIGLGLSLLGASSSNKATQKALNAKAAADTASRKATASSMIDHGSTLRVGLYNSCSFVHLSFSKCRY
nr:hypothetical protein 2 [bacterium]